MTALTRFFFRTTELAPPTATDVIGWWESRRPAYNVAVGAAGLVSLAVMKLFFILPPHSVSGFVPLGFVFAYAILANVFYTTGWVAELGLRKWLGDEVGPAGAGLFRYGFAFSIGLTFLPSVLSVLSWLLRVTIALV